MADSDKIYDDEQPERQPGLSDSGQDSTENNAEDLASAEDQEGEDSGGKKKRQPRTPWGKAKAEDEEEDKKLQDSLGSGLSSRLEDDEAEDTGFYKGRGDKKGTGLLKRGRGKLSTLRKNRWVLSGLGAGFIGIIVGGFTLFNFLNFFKLEHLLNNIDAKSFARINATFEHRSDKWMRAYITLRLAEMDGTLSKTDDDNLWIKANKVDTNRPLTDWYRTMRVNRFEERLLNKRGIYFTSTITPNGDSAFSRIQVGDRDLQVELKALSKDGKKIKFKDLTIVERQNLLRNVDGMVDKLYDGSSASKEMRNDIRRTVREETRFFQVMKRRHMRKFIQNKIGLTDWKFFEKTRNNITAKKSNIQKKLLRKLLPADTRGGKYILCLFAAGPCPKNADANNEENHSSKDFTGAGTESEGNKPVTDDQGNVQYEEDGTTPKTEEVGSNPGAGDVVEEATEAMEDVITQVGDEGGAGSAANALVRKEILKTIMSKINVVTAAISIVKTMDQLSRIDKNLNEGKLSEIAVLAKGTQAAAAYTTYAVMRDQTHSGDLISEEYGTIMEGFNGVENSEAYDYFFNQPNDQVSALSVKEDFCSNDHIPVAGEYYWNCDTTKVGGESNGTRIEQTYANSIGKVLTPVADGWREIRDAPGLKQLIDFAGFITDKFGDLISKAVEPLLRALGLDDDVEKFMVWLTAKLMDFIGAGPILSGVDDLPGLTMTMIGQGAAVVAEGTTRAAGAAISNPLSKAHTDRITLSYLEEEQQNKDFSERYFALDNPNSLLARAASGLSNLSLKKLGSIASWFGNASNNLGRIISPNAKAQTVQGAAAFAGIDSYDFPPQCLNLDPLTVTQATSFTNADDITNEAGEPFIDSNDITMDLLGNSEAFWDKVYDRVGDNETDAKKVLEVYNCETLEKQVRGSMGFTSGYSNDGGYGGNSSIAPPSTNSNMYILGDSLTVGMRAGGGIPAKLKSAGWDNAYISAKCGRSLTLRGTFNSCNAGEGVDSKALHAIDQIETPTDKNSIVNSGTIVIALGTNDFALTPQGQAGIDRFSSQIEELISKIRQTNNRQPAIYWVNLYSSVPGECKTGNPSNACMTPLNDALRNAASSLNFTVLDWASAATPYYPSGGNIHPSDYGAMADFVVRGVGVPAQ